MQRASVVPWAPRCSQRRDESKRFRPGCPAVLPGELRLERTKQRKEHTAPIDGHFRRNDAIRAHRLQLHTNKMENVTVTTPNTSVASALSARINTLQISNTHRTTADVVLTDACEPEDTPATAPTPDSDTPPAALESHDVLSAIGLQVSDKATLAALSGTNKTAHDANAQALAAALRSIFKSWRRRRDHWTTFASTGRASKARDITRQAKRAQAVGAQTRGSTMAPGPPTTTASNANTSGTVGMIECASDERDDRCVRKSRVVA